MVAARLVDLFAGRPAQTVNPRLAERLVAVEHRQAEVRAALHELNNALQYITSQVDLLTEQAHALGRAAETDFDAAELVSRVERGNAAARRLRDLLGVDAPGGIGR